MVESAASALARARRFASARGSSPFIGISSISVGRSASGSMPAWLSRPRRRGEPEARTSLGRPIMQSQSVCQSSREPLAESAAFDNLLVAGGVRGEAFSDPLRELVAHLAVRIEALLARALDRGRIGSRPVFDIGPERAGYLERAVMRFRRERHDQVEVEALPLFELFEGLRLVLADVEADLLHDGDRERVEFAFTNA